MTDGFVRVAAGTARIIVGNPENNAINIIALMREAYAMKAKLLALPEMCLTGYTIGDLVLQPTLRDSAVSALATIVKASRGMDMLTVLGMPLVVDSKLYNCAVAIAGGSVLGVVPKRNPPNYAEFYELRHFSPGPAKVRNIRLLGSEVPFGGNILFCCNQMEALKVGIEICEDLWVPLSPSIGHAMAGATIILNPSASNETVGKASYRELLLKSQSAKLVAGYVYADAGAGESTTDMVFSGHNLIAENGVIMAASKRYECGLVTGDIDVEFLRNERVRMNTFSSCTDEYTLVPFDVRMEKLELDRFVDPAPFVPFDEKARKRRCEDILDIQTRGLMTRLEHTGIKKAVVGVSGGLDSTLALYVTARAFQNLGLQPDAVTAITMPCFGTTERTRSNAIRLAECLGAKLVQIDISRTVRDHFEDIGLDEDKKDVAYENAQARERTQVLMDYANMTGGIVVGTGDLSELALGWATYNGDHMSMYSVNAGVPKTLVRHLVAHAAEQSDDDILKQALFDVLATPVSPELLPPKDGVISQVTESLVGPYGLHDFFLYHMVRRMSSPEKIRRLARVAFEGMYSREIIDKWLSTFIKRFFRQQFKRSCLPDGPKVGSVTLSPRGDWRMPSDASDEIWLKNMPSS
ncbi:MAG: NAD(+) synthase [Clostridia bacterium]|nr:NAD(+) synthase [Clostridia bacterium]